MLTKITVEIKFHGEQYLSFSNQVASDKNEMKIFSVIFI